MKLKLIFLIVMLGQFCFGQVDTLRVMSFNILHGATTKNDYNLDTIASVINTYNPDLVAMQEVDFKTNRAKKYDLPTEIGIRTGMASLFARAMYYDDGEYGEAVLSKFSFLSSENIALPHLPTSEPRAALVTKVKTKKGNVIQFVGTHLDHLEGYTDRLMQAKAINELIGKTDLPTILVGDLNADTDSETLKVLAKFFHRPMSQQTIGHTWPADNPNVTLDHVLFNMPEKWTVIDYTIVCENYASDHCIVIATLVFDPQNKN